MLCQQKLVPKNHEEIKEEVHFQLDHPLQTYVLYID